MTKIVLEYELTRKATEEDAQGIENAHSVYGFQRVKLAPALDRINVQFDATRLTEKDVANWLIRLGVPIRRQPIYAA